MDEAEIIAATLNNTIARNARTVQALEIEIANLTAEVIRLQRQIESTNMKTLKTPATKESK
jgi:predicted RNase H-like nuclease (RuvC/YqgF family)